MSVVWRFYRVKDLPRQSWGFTRFSQELRKNLQTLLNLCARICKLLIRDADRATVLKAECSKD
jgi:hypothetical protein